MPTTEIALSPATCRHCPDDCNAPTLQRESYVGLSSLRGASRFLSGANLALVPASHVDYESCIIWDKLTRTEDYEFEDESFNTGGDLLQTYRQTYDYTYTREYEQGVGYKYTQASGSVVFIQTRYNYECDDYYCITTTAYVSWEEVEERDAFVSPNGELHFNYTKTTTTYDSAGNVTSSNTVNSVQTNFNPHGLAVNGDATPSWTTLTYSGGYTGQQLHRTINRTDPNSNNTRIRHYNGEVIHTWEDPRHPRYRWVFGSGNAIVRWDVNEIPSSGGGAVNSEQKYASIVDADWFEHEPTGLYCLELADAAYTCPPRLVWSSFVI